MINECVFLLWIAASLVLGLKKQASGSGNRKHPSRKVQQAEQQNKDPNQTKANHQQKKAQTSHIITQKCTYMWYYIYIHIVNQSVSQSQNKNSIYIYRIMAVGQKYQVPKRTPVC